MVIKRSGVTEPFSRDKVIAGVRKACQGRPVTEDALAQLGQRVEEAVRATGSAELSTHDVGLAILGPLQELDLVAYLRFASVYRAFDSLEDFEAAIAELREQRAHEPRGRSGARHGRGRRSARSVPSPPPTEPAATSRPLDRGRACAAMRRGRQTEHTCPGKIRGTSGRYARYREAA